MTQPNIRGIDPGDPQEKIIIMAAEIMTGGELVVAPTETRYGLLARSDDNKAINRMFALKQRDLMTPTALFVRSRKEISLFGYETEISGKLSRAFLPGPLTLVLKARTGESPPVVVDGKIGIRYSSSPVIRALLDKVDFNFTATSANLSGSGDPATAAEIAALFGPTVSLYLDAGPLKEPPSTVVDCSSEAYRILRPGAISREKIEEVLEKSDG